MFDHLYSSVSTEKTRRLAETQNKYAFDLDETLTKPEIKKLFEAIYKVKIVKVHTQRLPLKRKRVRSQSGFKSRRKRALLTLEKGAILKHPKIESGASKTNI